MIPHLCIFHLHAHVRVHRQVQQLYQDFGIFQVIGAEGSRCRNEVIDWYRAIIHKVLEEDAGDLHEHCHGLHDI